MMDAIAIIPARAGSQRIPGKNWKDFHGKPIIQYSIETATRSGQFDRVVVTTDGPEIAEIAHRSGAMVVWRPKALAADNVGTQDVASCTLDYFKDWADLACCIYPTAPMLTTDDLMTGRALLVNAGERWDYVMSVGSEPLRDAGCFYWGRAQAFLDRRKLIGPRTIMYRLPEDRVCDINTPEDWYLADKMYAAIQRKNNE